MIESVRTHTTRGRLRSDRADSMITPLEIVKPSIFVHYFFCLLNSTLPSNPYCIHLFLIVPMFSFVLQLLVSDFVYILLGSSICRTDFSIIVSRHLYALMVPCEDISPLLDLRLCQLIIPRCTRICFSISIK